MGRVEADFVMFGDGVNLAQDMCTVCAECTMGVEIVLAVPNGTPGDVGWEARFSLFGDCVSLDAR